MEKIIGTIGEIALAAFAIFALVRIVSSITGTDGLIEEYIRTLISTIFQKANETLQPTGAKLFIQGLYYSLI